MRIPERGTPGWPSALLLLAACIGGCRGDVPEAGPRGVVDTAFSAGIPVVFEESGSGHPPLVFIHCWACDRAIWRHQLVAFTADHRVVTLDLPGHGASGADSGSGTVAAAAGAVTAVLERLGLRDAILVGHSLGGTVALEVARRAPERVQGIACIETLHNAERVMDEEDVEETVAALETNYARTMRGFVDFALGPNADTAVLAPIMRGAMAADREVVLDLVRDVSKLDLRRVFRRAAKPIRCINAEPNPPAVPVTETGINQRYADFEARIISGTGHFPLLERPAELNRMLRETINELRQGGS